MTSHPLEDEDVQVIVSLVHKQTLTSGTGVCDAPADAPPDVTEAALVATQAALDQLLAQLEQRG